MATLVGTDTLNAISNRVVIPRIMDEIYGRNPLPFRLLAGNKRRVDGGTQIEVPVLYSDASVGGWFQGYELIDTTPFDVVKNVVFDWKEFSVPVSLSKRDLIKANSPDAIANLIRLQFDIAQKRAAEILGTAMWNTGTGAAQAKMLTSIPFAVDTADPGGSISAYGGQARSGNTWWQGVEDGSTAVNTYANINSNFLTASVGAYSPTIILSRLTNFYRTVNQQVVNQQFPVPVGGADDILLSAGFTNILFNNVPWVIDDKVPDANSIYGLNEDTFELVVTPLGDFSVEEWRMATNQMAMVSHIYACLELICNAPRLNFKMTAVAA